MKNESDVKDNCWSLPEYKCCSEGIESIYEDSLGKWGMENSDWCGIITNNYEPTDT